MLANKQAVTTHVVIMTNNSYSKRKNERNGTELNKWLTLAQPKTMETVYFFFHVVHTASTQSK